MIIPKKLLSTLEIASKDLSRPGLGSVRFEDHKAIATDGFKMVIYNLPEQNGLELPEVGRGHFAISEPISLNAMELKKCLSLIPYKTSLPVLQNAWTEVGESKEAIKITSSDLATVNQSELKLQTDNYPDYKKVLPKSKPVGVVAVNGKYLIEVVTALIKARSWNTDNIVTIEIRGEREPLLFKAQGDEKNDILGVLMPVSLNK